MVSAVADAARAPAPRRVSLNALLILLVSLAATLAAWRWTAQQGEALEAIRFQQFADEAVSELAERMDGYGQLLQSAVALMDASDEVTREEWRRFVARLDMGGRYPGTLGLGVAVRVSGAEDWAAHEQAVRAEGFSHYAVRPPGPRDLAFPIKYIEPFNWRNERAFGYDMFSDPVRREAMTRARDSGLPAITGKVVLVQETEQDTQPGVLLYVPFYGGEVPAEVERRSAVRGFVYSPLRMGDLVRAVMGGRLDSMCMQVYDEQTEADRLLFSNGGCEPGTHGTERALTEFGRVWIVRIQSTSQLDANIASRRSKLILGAGAVISLLLMWAVMAMLAERRRHVALGRALAELEVARAEAAGALAAKGRFLAAASHDLRQPLQSLGLYLHMMVEQRGERGPVEQAAEQAYAATARLVDAMFDAAALESGRAKPVLSRFDVGALVERIAAESKAEAAERGLALRARACHVEVQTDQVMLERILRNLVNNAVKYTVSGGILLACRVAGDTVRIKVADSGPGIPADKLDLIFEDFYQIENPQRDPRKGLGLGLATVSRLARVLGYRLDVRSRPGLGSTFVVIVPRTYSAHGAPRDPAGGDGPPQDFLA